MPLDIVFTPIPVTFDGTMSTAELSADRAIDVSCFDQLDLRLQVTAADDTNLVTVTVVTAMSRAADVWIPIATFRPPPQLTSCTMVRCACNPLRFVRFIASSAAKSGAISLDGVARKHRHSAFSPGSHANVAFWLRADAISSIPSGMTVDTWPDSGPLGNDFRQNSPTAQPVFVRDALNGLPSIKFDGTDDYMTSSVSDTLHDFTAVLLFRHYGAAQNSYERVVDKNYVDGFWIGRDGTSVDQWGGGVQEASYPYGAFGMFADGSPNILILRRKGSTVDLYKGTTLLVSRVVSNTPTDQSLYRLAVAYLGSLYSFAAIELFEAIVYSSALTDTTLSQACQYLREKWRIL